MTEADEPRILTSVRDGIGHLRLNRPALRNAIDAATVHQVREAIASFSAQGVWAAVLEAEGSIFCAGGDRAELGTTLYSASTLVEVVSSAPLFWAARIQGGAVGGGMALALTCPLVYCTPAAWFDLPEVRHGFLPTAVLAYLEPLVGARRALHLSLYPERITAERAVELGLAEAVVAEDQIDAAIAQKLAPLAASPRIAKAAAIAWQSRWTSAEFRARRALLMDLL